MSTRRVYVCDHCGADCTPDMHRFYVSGEREKRSWNPVSLSGSGERSGHLCEPCARTLTVENACRVLPRA